MQKFHNPHLKEEIIDEQMVLIPDEEGWEILRSSPLIDGVNILSEETIGLLWEQIEFCKSYPELRVGLYKPGPILNKWIPLILLCINNISQRVTLEELTCTVCGWRGQTANPLPMELYIGVPNKWDVIKATEKYSVLPCPKCKSKLPRYPIWIEPIK